MFTIKQIKNGRGYMHRHLSQNDYYSEGQKVTGIWRGDAAKRLGIEGTPVIDEHFNALRENRNPLTGEKLRPRNSSIEFHDITLSAPKTVSIAAMVGGDERLIEAYERCALKAFKRLEKFAEVRDRSGANYNSEKTIRTSNTVAAVFNHDTSRLLDPQLHTHFVFSNHTWSDTANDWRALQTKRMMEESKRTVRQQFYRDLASEAGALGYRIEWMKNGFRLADMDKQLDVLFSRRAVQRRAFEHRYQSVFGKAPDKKRMEHFIKDVKSDATRRFVAEYQAAFKKEPGRQLIEHFVTDWRTSKMATSTSEKVLERQMSQMNTGQKIGLAQLVSDARMNVAAW